MCVPTLGSNSAVVVVLFRDDNWTAGKIGWSGGLCALWSLHGLDVMKRVRRGAEQYRFAFGRVDTAPGKSRVLVLQDNDVYT